MFGYVGKFYSHIKAFFKLDFVNYYYVVYNELKDKVFCFAVVTSMQMFQLHH